MTTIAVDAMGGDHAPKVEVEGAIRAAGSLNVRVLLVGQQDVLHKESLCIQPQRTCRSGSITPAK